MEPRFTSSTNMLPHCGQRRLALLTLENPTQFSHICCKQTFTGTSAFCEVNVNSGKTINSGKDIFSQHMGHNTSIVLPWDHLFRKCTKFPEKLTFLSPDQGVRSAIFSENFAHLLNR